MIDEKCEPADYRGSHLDRGPSYDQTLAGSPFDYYMAEVERLRLQEIIQRLFPAGIPRYLDFACGTGRITQVVAPKAQEAIGVDVSPSMLDLARPKCPQTRFVLADLTAGDHSLGHFDCITSFRFFGNAEQPLREKVIAVLGQLVAPGGWLIVNNHRNPYSLAALRSRLGGLRHGMNLTHGRLRSLLNRGGFEVRERHPIGAWLYRSRLIATVPAPDAETARKEAMFGHPVFTAIAPDSIIVARRES